MRKKTRGRGRGRPPALIINNNNAGGADTAAAADADEDNANEVVADDDVGGSAVDTREDELRKSLKRKYASSILSLKVRARQPSPNLKKGRGGAGVLFQVCRRHDHGEQTIIKI